MVPDEPEDGRLGQIEFKEEVYQSIRSIDPLEWDRCNATGHRLSSHAYLCAIEDSGSLERIGSFSPRHVLLRDQHGKAVAAVPAYLKMHSIGELGADFGFPMSHDRSSGPYYPKLQAEIPLTPLTGPRLLVACGHNKRQLQRALIGALTDLAVVEGVSSVQIAFMLEEEMEAAKAAGLQISSDIQFIWQNRGYACFRDFLAEMSKSRRHMVRRERRVSLEGGLSVDWIGGLGVTPALCRKIAALLDNTYRKYRTPNWFTGSYFEKLFSYLGDDVQIALVSDSDGEPVGATVFMVSGHGLEALQWGGSEERQFLMFETTLYQGIERAIRDGFAAVNFGSLGGHKANRGALPADTFHAFWFRDPAFRPLAAASITARQKLVGEQKIREMERSPFRSGNLKLKTKP